MRKRVAYEPNSVMHIREADMTDTSVQPIAESTPGLSQLQRVTNAFAAPAKTFEDIKQGHTSWWLPFLLFVIVGTGLWATVNSKVTWPTVVENGLRMAPKQAERLQQLPPDQQETQKKYSAMGQKYIWLFAPAFVLLMNVIAAGVLLGTINFGFGGRAKFSQVLAVSWYAGLPGLIKLVLGIVGLYAGVAAESFMPANPAGTNIAYYLAPPPETNIALWSLCAALDITFIWTLVLFSKGLAKVAGTKPSAGYTAVFGWWAVYLIISIGLGAAFS
jgi:hypothetical protein